MQKTIGSFRDDTQDVYMFDDMTYRYEPGYSLRNTPSSFFKINEHGDVFYKHHDSEKWYYLDPYGPSKVFVKNILRIYSNYVIETLILGEDDNGTTNIR